MTPNIKLRAKRGMTTRNPAMVMAGLNKLKIAAAYGLAMATSP
jgi:hypothetical protein